MEVSFAAKRIDQSEPWASSQNASDRVDSRPFDREPKRCSSASVDVQDSDPLLSGLPVSQDLDLMWFDQGVSHCQGVRDG